LIAALISFILKKIGVSIQFFIYSFTIVVVFERFIGPFTLCCGILYSLLFAPFVDSVQQQGSGHVCAEESDHGTDDASPGLHSGRLHHPRAREGPQVDPQLPQETVRLA
jgi:hypothetical protein